jgi:hypothetical protein
VVTTKDVVFFGRVWFYSWVHFDYVNVREKRRGNEEWTSQRRGLLRAQDTQRRQTKQKKTTTTQKNKHMSNTDPTKKTTLNKTKQNKNKHGGFFVYLNDNMFDFWLN